MNPEEREALVRTSTDAWNSNDFETLKAIWSPEGVIVSPEGWPEVGTFSGWDAMVAQWRRIKESWAEERVSVEGRRLAKMTYFLDERAARAAAEEKR